MSISSSNIFDNYDRNKKKGSGHNIAAILCCVMIIIFVITSVWINRLHREEESVLPEFIAALDAGDYDRALQLYRGVHDTVVAADPSEVDSVADETKTLSQMEDEVNRRLVTIETMIRNDRYAPSTADSEFMNELGELTSSQISGWLHDLCVEFLLGTIEKPDIIFIFNQMTEVGSISASATPLLQEIETIEMARGDVQYAEAAFSEADYVLAVQTYQNVTSRYTGFVLDYSTNRITEIKDIMYEPMLSEGEQMLSTMKYYSAEDLFADMAVIFPDDQRISSDLLEATSHTTATTVYHGTVEVLSVRTLIANPLASGADSSLFLTTTEFRRMLEELYANDYVVVDAETLADLSNDTFITEMNLVVPEGKKPVILVLDTFDYSAYNYSVGCCSRLVLNDRNQVCGEYLNSEGQMVISREAEAIGILEAFIEEYPDFAFDGAKGVISVCGYESCFGYVISEDEIDDRNSAYSAVGYPSAHYSTNDIEANRATVMSIMNTLRSNGWKFATSTYGNINAYASDMATIQADTEKWMEQIGSLMGDVHMIVYPGGNYIYGTDERAEYLKALGFRIFFGIGSNPYYIYGSNYLYYDRTVINDEVLRYSDVSRLFDASVILDEEITDPQGEQEPI